ncbi:biliverdin-producing heme oxygenase, partial [Mitsuaria sp. TWR114]|uniref:biliverdin-producing heme oxygenase n=1 Tax=Mitsuaria sp. TWR114 TaxID=2601731 RepID=UPI0011BFE061
AAFGSLYVLEGSALGGQVLTPMLLARHGLTPERGAAYFHGFGERTGAMWREFRQLADAQAGANETDRDAACHAAVQTFQALIETFASVGAGAPDLPVAATAPSMSFVSTAAATSVATPQ